jgi:amidohydrolase
MRYTILVFLGTTLCLFVNGQLSENIEIRIQEEVATSLALCKHLHQHPELSFLENETSTLMEQELEHAGFTVSREFGGNNVVGVLKNGDGPVILVRADMDALPIEEKTGLTFSSTKKMKDTSGEELPVMHACGHDIHMSVWAGTLRTMHAFKEQWKGTLVAIAQQAEEKSGGAGLAIEKGLFESLPVPDYGLAFHINPELESGTIGLVEGPVFAGVKSVEITVFGKGGHGAYPEKCIDPIVMASRIVLDLQTIVSREISPLEPVVVTVGSIHGGTRSNIIPDEVKMELTLRYYSEEIIEKVIASISRICESAGRSAGMPEDQLPMVVVFSTSPTPPVLNDPNLTRQVAGFASAAIGKENIITVQPAMVAEDFGRYGHTPEKVPINLIWLGSTSAKHMQELKSKGESPAPLHSPELKPDYEKTIETGIRVMVGNLLGLMDIDQAH